MPDRLETLRAFIDGRGRPVRRIDPALECLQPFFQAPAEPPYSLVKADRGSIRTVSRLIARLTGHPLERLVLVSVQPPGAGYTTAQASAALRERLTPKIWSSLGHHLYVRYGQVGLGRLGPGTLRDLRQLVEASLGGNPLDSLAFSLRDLVGEPFTDVLTYYLAAFMAGDEWAFGELLDLVAWVPRHLPLGDHAGYQATWYVLTA